MLIHSSCLGHDLSISMGYNMDELVKSYFISRKNHTNLEDLAGFVENEMACSGQVQGYWWLHARVVKRIYVLSQDSWSSCLKKKRNSNNFSAPTETARRNHKNVSDPEQKCAVYKIRKSSFRCYIPFCHLKLPPVHTDSNMTFILVFFPPVSQNLAACLLTWLFRWSGFSTKRRSLSMQKF